MRISDPFLLPNRTTREPGGASSPADADDANRPIADLACASPADLDEANRLISDLAVLIDAGLVVVCEQLDGPARYDAVSAVADA